MSKRKPAQPSTREFQPGDRVRIVYTAEARRVYVGVQDAAIDEGRAGVVAGPAREGRRFGNCVWVHFDGDPDDRHVRMNVCYLERV
jgi:hypothetical protein